MGETTGTEAGTGAVTAATAAEAAAGATAEAATGTTTGTTTGTAARSGVPGQAAPGVPASLEVEGLAFAYPDGHQALFGVDMRVERGERVALLGPNGAGKTTLVLHLNGILSAATGTGRGTVRVAGLEVAKRNLREIRRRVGIVFQDPDDQLFMPSVREDVAFGPANLGLRGAELDERVAEALDRVGMARYADRPPHHLSFGQRRRVAVATVLAMRPEILVLDEPSSNLDPASRRELAEILDGLDVTVLMVTHDLPYALELCPRSLVLSGGVIAADGPTRELLADRELMDAHRLELPYGYARPDCDHCAPHDARGGPWGRPGPGPACGGEHG
ncbi:energy-coupling factor ABC transporter ATP-binding protein [Streptodolium elevatio]